MDELFGDAELSFVKAVVIGDVTLCFWHRDDHALLFLPEHLLGRDGPLEMVLLKHTMRERVSKANSAPTVCQHKFANRLHNSKVFVT